MNLMKAALVAGALAVAAPASGHSLAYSRGDVRIVYDTHAYSSHRYQSRHHARGHAYGYYRHGNRRGYRAGHHDRKHRDHHGRHRHHDRCYHHWGRRHSRY